MADADTYTCVQARNPKTASHRDDIVAILEHQLEGFRAIQEVTAKMKEQFIHGGSIVLAQGARRRADQLRSIQESEKRLIALKREWEATSQAGWQGDQRIHALIDACQATIHRIVELDRQLHEAAKARQESIQGELAGIHQRRRPIHAYLEVTPATKACPVTVTGRNVARNA